MKQIFYCALAMLMFVACGNRTSPQTVTDADAKADSIAALQSRLQQTTDPIARLPMLKQLAGWQMATLPEAEAIARFEQLQQEVATELEELHQTEADLLENYWQYNENEPAHIEQKQQLYTAAGVELVNVGEGYHEFRLRPDFYASFASILPADYADLLALQQQLGTNPIAQDGGLVIEHAELADRLLLYEAFMARHPDSKLTTGIREGYHDERLIYLTGLDNTPIMDRSCRLLPEARAELKRFVQAHPTSPTARLAQIVLDEKETDPATLYRQLQQANAE